MCVCVRVCKCECVYVCVCVRARTHARAHICMRTHTRLEYIQNQPCQANKVQIPGKACVHAPVRLTKLPKSNVHTAPDDTFANTAIPPFRAEAPLGR